MSECESLLLYLTERNSLNAFVFATGLDILTVHDALIIAPASFASPTVTVLLDVPDIDKWAKWEVSIVEMIKSVDYAFLDGTFFDEKEINNRDISEIPHPFIIESLKLFKELDESEKSKVYFIHLNHTNPVLNSESSEYKKVISAGFNIAKTGMEFFL